jgi:hypothetical protein
MGAAKNIPITWLDETGSDLEKFFCIEVLEEDR